MHSAEYSEVGLAFYKSEMAIIENRIEELEACGLSLGRRTFIRAFIHVTSNAELIASATRLAEHYKSKQGPRESENVAARPAADIVSDDAKRIDAVLDHLASKDIIHGSRAFVIRAAVRFSPSGAALAPAIATFLKDYPNKPRGASVAKARKAKKGKPHG